MISRVLAGLGAIVLLAIAYLHSTAYSEVQTILAQAGVEGFFGAALPVMWMFFSWHLVVIALPMLLGAITNPPWFLPAAIFCGTVVLVDFFWVYSITGWFPGTIGLLLAFTTFAGACAVLLRSNVARVS